MREVDSSRVNCSGVVCSASHPLGGLISETKRFVGIDLRTLRDRGVYGFVEVPPPYRLRVKDYDMPQATRDLGLK